MPVTASSWEGVSHHFVCAPKHELEKQLDEFAHKILFDVDARREFPVHRILAHNNAGKIAFVKKSGFSLGISEIS